MPTLKWGPQAEADPVLEKWQANTYGQKQKLGKAGKYYRNMLTKIGSGDDVSSMPFLQTMRDTFANQRAEIDDSYMTGANKMLAEGGGENALLMNRMRQYETDKQSQREGQASGAALSDLSEQAGRGYQSAYDSANARQLQQQGLALGSRNDYYNKRNQSYLGASGWDKFKDVANLLTGHGM